MGDHFIVIALALLFLAVYLGEDFVFTLLYLVLGAYLLARLWGSKALEGVAAARKLPERIFYGETVEVELEVVNKGWLPVVWLQVHESMPLDLTSVERVNHVVSLGAQASASFRYPLEGRKRGYYDIGPLNLFSGDVFGVIDRGQRLVAATPLIVYPKIVALRHVPIPSQSPSGTLRHKQPVFEDPTRISGVREYIHGDSLRRVNWKTSASSGRLQVKKFEPSIALETSIFLNLNTPEYHIRDFFYASELGIVVAASIANWVISRRQTSGLVTNGVDPLDENRAMMPIPPRSGRSHLMRILDALARVQAAEGEPFAETLHRARHHLSWGTTVVLITGPVSDEIFDAIFQTKRAGLNVMLLPVGRMAGSRQVSDKAKMFGIPYYHIATEDDLDLWRV